MKKILILLIIGASTILIASVWECIVASEITGAVAQSEKQIYAINAAYMKCDVNTTEYFECTLSSCMRIR